jgi:hypothetical protein
MYIDDCLTTRVDTSYSYVFNGVLFFLFFPEREVFFKELDDGFSISESFLINIVDLLEGVRKCGLSKFTCFLVIIHDFIVENREVKSKSKSDWVAGIQRS